MSEVVEANVFQVGILQDFFMELHHRVRVVHFTGHRRREHVLVIRVLAVFLDQQVDRILWDGYLPDRRFCLGPGEHYLSAGVSDVLLADGDCLVLCIEVRP